MGNVKFKIIAVFTQELLCCLDVLEPFIEEVIPKERKDQYYDYSEVIEIDLILEEYFNAA
ncbi:MULTISPECIES: hypothetical protein [Blautia]|uniref:Uncharacterized protein n=1 Tax=Blautia hansenii DSM 20583 TaxID=537007 RepID=C9L9U1_BLAHA|nr:MULTISPECIES: hypothetical protein [Blautia]ASM70135.1 hypothetical protein CGC63_11900 [Blautia hansenii DSM 20583]EEX21078.1 hypothetical protein BLAHAN_06181 [Blautia hansenii DSM 20583]MBS5092251.1 hypothetical protein [Lachnospiraceae bacterium]UWO09974.1 hypothetical protein NQ538_11950 [Blautia hansenii DSM 20583]